MTTAPSVYIAVLNWHGADKTIACLQSLDTLDYPDYRVIVVDNASADDSVKRIRAAFPGIEIIEADTNLGYAGGNELALHRALQDERAELFWILNNDATVQPDTLTQLVNAYLAHGPAICGGLPVEITADGQVRLNNSFVELTATDPPHPYIRKLVGKPVSAIFENVHLQHVGSVPGSCMLLPLSICRAHGFMRTDLFLYGEDTDYCLRLGQQGVVSMIVPDARIIHERGGSGFRNNRLTPIISYYRTRNHLLVYRWYLGPARFWQQVLRLLAHSAAYTLLTLRDGRVSLAVAYFTLLGIADALRGRTGKRFAPEDRL